MISKPNPPAPKPPAPIKPPAPKVDVQKPPVKPNPAVPAPVVGQPGVSVPTSKPHKKKKGDVDYIDGTVVLWIMLILFLLIVAGYLTFREK